MSDGDNDHLTDPQAADTALFVATTIASILLAGSAYLWRAHLRFPTVLLALSKRAPQDLGHVPADPSDPSKHHPSTSDAFRADNTGKSKSPRSKERRRRGKDPLRDILKNGKKLKALSKINLTSADLDRLNNTKTTSPLTITTDSSPQSHSLSNMSAAPSSRSASSSRSRTHSDQQGSRDPEPTQHDYGNQAAPAREPALSVPLGATVSGTDSSSGLANEHSEFNSCSAESGVPLPELDCARDSLATQHQHPPTSRSHSDSGIHWTTSPLQPSPESSSVSNTTSIHTHRKTLIDEPEDHAGTQGPSDPKYTTSTSVEQSPSSVFDSTTSLDTTSRSKWFSSPQALSPVSLGTTKDASPSSRLANSNIAGSSAQLPHRKSNTSSTENSGHTVLGANNNVNGVHGMQRITPARRAPTPSSGTNTPPPSLSTQTQLASLRGALEAARQREAQMRLDLERCAKELEFMRWESATWRRKEFELQNQVNYLTHQLQTVTTSFSSIPLGVPSTSSPALPSNGTGTSSSSSSNSSSSANASPTKNGYHVPLPSQNPTALSHIIPPSMQGMATSGMFSPISMMRSIPSPVYYAYPPIGGTHSHHHNYSHFSPQMHSHSHTFPLSPTQPVSNQVNFMSVFSPNGTVGPNTGGVNSGPSSAPGSSSSVGSLSPGNRKFTTMMDRGRRRTRGNIQMGGWIGTSMEEDDGYIQEGDGYYEMSDEDETEVSEALADAILKRPGSLRLGNARSRKLPSSPSAELVTDKSSPSGSENQTEFTFPSLSNLGNVKWGQRTEKPNVNKDNVSVGAYPTDAIYPDIVEVIGDTTFTAERNPPSLEGLELLDTVAHNSAIEDPQPGASELPAG
ncbi:hypothetical protein AX15_002397 [Amanita polypyramis BW_CC]|nr:hypothetical protein AX15_002397 [Amanita polypyramis BW_CC]